MTLNSKYANKNEGMDANKDTRLSNFIRKTAIAGVIGISTLLPQHIILGNAGQPLQKTDIKIVESGFKPNEHISIIEDSIPRNNYNNIVLADTSANLKGILRCNVTAYALNPFNTQCVIVERDMSSNKIVDTFVLDLATKTSGAKIGHNINALTQNLSDYSSIMLENNKHQIKLYYSKKDIAPADIPSAKPFFNITDPNANKRVADFKVNNKSIKEEFISLLHSPIGDISMIAGLFATIATLIYLETKLIKKIFRPIQRR